MNARRTVVALIVVALLVSGCSGKATSTAPAANPAGSGGAAATAPGPSATATGPMTGDELVWLEAMGTLPRKMGKVLIDSSSSLTPATLRSLAEGLRGCTRELTGLGSPTDRLRPVYDVAKQGCAKYDQAAKCFDTAARIGIPVMGTADERKFDKAIKCGFAVPEDGTRLLVEAETLGVTIKESAAR